MRKIRHLRGQVIVRELGESLRPSSVIWTPDPNRNDVHIHKGVVLAFGPPALIWDHVEVPHGFVVGDVVIYTFRHHQEAFTRTWEDGLPATWVPQDSVQCVVEP